MEALTFVLIATIAGGVLGIYRVRDKKLIELKFIRLAAERGAPLR